ncbi:MAG: DUF1830 domain-containing protein [Leptolyngbyaceae cyanobacterium]
MKTSIPSTLKGINHSPFQSETGNSSRLLCTYTNHSDRQQVIRFVKGTQSAWERSLGPGQHIQFTACTTDSLEVLEYVSITTVCSDTLRCQDLVSIEMRSSN